MKKKMEAEAAKTANTDAGMAPNSKQWGGQEQAYHWAIDNKLL